jgi:hypothetical protein
MVEQRKNLDYGRDEETPSEASTSVEGDGFTMTDTDIERPAIDSVDDVDYEADDEEHNPEAETLGSP